MLHVLSRHWLRLRGKPTLTVVLKVESQVEPVKVGDDLVDESGQEFKLVGVGHVRYATEADAKKHQGEYTVTLAPAKDGTEPLSTLQKKPTYQGEATAGDPQALHSGSLAAPGSGG